MSYESEFKAAVVRPNRQRIWIGLLIVLVIIAFGATIVMIQNQVIQNQNTIRYQDKVLLTNQQNAFKDRQELERLSQRSLQNQILIAKELRVRGVTGLRVSPPTPPSGFTK